MFSQPTGPLACFLYKLVCWCLLRTNSSNAQVVRSRPNNSLYIPDTPSHTRFHELEAWTMQVCLYLKMMLTLLLLYQVLRKLVLFIKDLVIWLKLEQG